MMLVPSGVSSRGALALATGALAALAVPALLALSSSGSAPAATAATPDFARDVAPIVRETCLNCHREGGIAPFAFRTERDLASRASLIVAAVTEGRMPPWPPSARSPAYGGQAARTLDRRERETLVRWARSQLVRPGSARRGTPLRPPVVAGNAAQPGETRREIAMPTAYRPAGAKGSTDDYRCFLLDPKLTSDASVTSARIAPGAASLVHHVILYRLPPASVAEAQRLDASTPGTGWTCFGGPGVGGGTSEPRGFLDDAGWIAAWAPGWGSDRLRTGTGIELPAGSRIVMQVHYNLSNGKRPDRSRAVLTTVPAARRLTPVQTLLLPAPVELACRRGERGPLCDRTAAVFDQVDRFGADSALVASGLLLLCGKDAARPVPNAVSSCERRLGGPVTIQAVAGHMHLLGRSIRVELNPGTPRARLLLEIPRWSFHWQASYALQSPVQAGPEDVLRVTCRHDTRLRRGEPRYVLWGEGTADEMCLGVVQVTPR
jgi:Copper type II ascorbate-dependent monooxygenase, C-terminal domain